MTNQHKLNCTCDDQANCSGCNINGKLACKWDKKILGAFHGIAWPPFILSIVGMVVVLAVNYTAHGLIPLLGLSGIFIGIIATSLSFINTLKLFFCSSCVNFSCPLNTVPKTVIDEYLRKNDVMREAWLKSGWQLD